MRSVVESLVRKVPIKLNPEIGAEPDRADEVVYKMRSILLIVSKRVLASLAKTMFRRASVNADQLLEALSLSEDFEIEFKSARGGVPRSLWESYCAFANTDGGVIVLGVKQHSSNRFEIQGLEDAEKVRQDFWNNVNNRSHVSHNLLGNEDVRIVKFNSDQVLVVNVPRAGRFERPIYLGPNPLTGTYRRYHEGDYRCDENEVRRMISDSDDQTSADSRVLSKFGISDVHVESLQAYRNRFRSRDAIHPWLELDVLDFLR
ncbi:MAG: ATP-binding protein, partial [Planctomycetota bacterium]|nr:ATP-binding protein [Planctomycetota bacterium]